jgi:hypothetical protein
MIPLKTMAVASALLFPLGVQAATIDFTDTSSYAFAASGFSGTAGSSNLGYTVSPVPSNRPLTQNVPFDGTPVPAGTGLALETDGLGVGNDEITQGNQRIVVEFARLVRITGLHFLDLFQDLTGPTLETALVEFDGKSASFDAIYDRNAPGGDFGGYAFYGDQKLVGSKFTFSVMGTGNDQQGSADFALAAIELAPVPLPASVLLLGAALGGLGLMRRRKHA